MGPDGGIDAVGSDVVAQVKAHMKPVGRPEVQQLAGVALVEGRTGVFFSLAGYTHAAIAFAEAASIALFRFGLDGGIDPVNRSATDLHARL